MQGSTSSCGRDLCRQNDASNVPKSGRQSAFRGYGSDMHIRFNGGMNYQQIEIHDAVVHCDSICGKVFRCLDPGQTDEQTWSN